MKKYYTLYLILLNLLLVLDCNSQEAPAPYKPAALYDERLGSTPVPALQLNSMGAYTAGGLHIIDTADVVKLNKFYALAERMVQYRVRLSADARAVFRSSDICGEIRERGKLHSIKQIHLATMVISFILILFKMKRFTKTRFFLLIKENNNNLSSLEDEYEKFSCHLFAENIVDTNKETYHSSLIYTRVELESLLMRGSKKKCDNIYSQSHWVS
jgi:hypothetical protein